MEKLYIFLLLSSIILNIIAIVISTNAIIYNKNKIEKIHRVFIPTNRKKEEYYNKFINKNHE